MFKTITVSKDAYDKLTAVKRKNESFSELIIELSEKTSLDRFFGTISKTEADELRKSYKKDRARVSTYYEEKKWK